VRSALPAWRRRPLVPASVALHVAAAATIAWRASDWPWAAGAVLADHALLAAVGLWPRSRGLGPNWTRLPESAGAARVAVTIDDGPDPEVTPRVLEVLARASARATFFCVGERVAAEPALSREIVTAGHRIENHSQRHLHRFSLLGPRAMRAEIERAQATITAVTGVTPRFFRAPAGLRNPFLDGILETLSLELVSWTRRGFDTVERDPGRVFARLTRGLAARDIVLLHDGHAARARAGEPVILAVLPRLLERLAAQGLTPVTLDAALPA
jgi:peptidoglycan/xylan/chitin deacetylase (PgdA/CDA1 family)